MWAATLFAQTTPPAESEPRRDSITVTERISTEAPASITILDRGALAATPGVSLDDRLRSVPGFSLFRRSSSLAAHPTTQGISLRGLGSTGASRTLFLWDGIPANSPFGGWIYWTRLDPDEFERVELSRGASTSVFGDRAMGGAIVSFSRPPERHRVRLAYEGGGLETHELSGAYAHLGSRMAGTAYARGFTTDGYYLVPERFRGSADQRAGVRFAAGVARLDFTGAHDRLFLKFDALAEDRRNGTLIQRNSTSLGTIAANYTHEGARDGFSLLGYHTREEFHAAFSAVAANRNSDRLTFNQRVPSEALGAAAMWRRSAPKWHLLAGADVDRSEGYSTDTLLADLLRFGGGIRLQHGVFGQFDATAGPAKIFLGARSHRVGDDYFFSPSGGLAVGRGPVRARASVYRSFRAPTLNELYREFRAGNAQTLANPALQPETLVGVEAGFDVTGETRRLSVSLFRNSLDQLISNVTVSQTPALTVRQRRNAAEAVVRGFEIEAHQRWRDFRGEISYLFADSRFSTGERIPQVARHQGVAQVLWARDGTLVSVGLRSFSAQFEDDRNQFVLPGFATMQLAARQKIVGSLSATFALENALDREFWTGFAVIPTIPAIGAPRLWRVGLRWDGPIR